MAYANVLPAPVRAFTNKSDPCSANGIVRDCTNVGWMNLSLANALNKRRSRERVEKVWVVSKNKAGLL